VMFKNGGQRQFVPVERKVDADYINQFMMIEIDRTRH